MARDLAAHVEGLKTPEGDTPLTAPARPAPPVETVGQCPHCGAKVSIDHICDQELLEKLLVAEAELKALKNAAPKPVEVPRSMLQEMAAIRRLRQEHVSDIVREFARPSETALPLSVRYELSLLRTLFRRSRGHMCPPNRECRLCLGIMVYEAYLRALGVDALPLLNAAADPQVGLQLNALRERDEAIRERDTLRMEVAAARRALETAQRQRHPLAAPDATFTDANMQSPMMHHISEVLGTYGATINACVMERTTTGDNAIISVRIPAGSVNF
jgi:hypothetical protein